MTPPDGISPPEQSLSSAVMVGTADPALEFKPENESFRPDSEPAESPTEPALFGHVSTVESSPVTTRTPLKLAIVAILGVATAALVWRVVSGGAPAPTGSLNVDTEPAGAEVLIDGSLRGVTPLLLSLPQGRHSMVVRRGAETRETTVEIEENHGKAYHIILSQPPPADAIFK